MHGSKSGRSTIPNGAVPSNAIRNGHDVPDGGCDVRDVVVVGDQ
jgi:hypothetical protein